MLTIPHRIKTLRIFSLIWLAVFGLGLSMAVAQQPSTGSIKTNKDFPVFKLADLNGTQVWTSDYRKAGEPIVLMYFSPTCSHCQAQTEQITSNMKQLDKAKFLLITAYPVADVTHFVSNYGLAAFKNIDILHDPDFKLGQFLDLKELPGLFVYNGAGKLVKVFEKATSGESLVKAIQQNP